MRPLHQLAFDKRVRVIASGDDGMSFVAISPLVAEGVDFKALSHGVRIDNLLRVIVSNGLGWDHASVSLERRCPVWAEMEFIKRLCFEADETAMQLHVPPADHINCHPYTLHLWRPQRAEIPRPPGILVGPVESSTAQMAEDART